jgi:hypothetical protein
MNLVDMKRYEVKCQEYIFVNDSCESSVEKCVNNGIYAEQPNDAIITTMGTLVNIGEKEGYDVEVDYNRMKIVFYKNNTPVKSYYRFKTEEIIEKDNPMNNICKTCDTRIRLRICNGREGDFKYCFRRVGTRNGLEETITPFNTIEELYDKCKWLKNVIKDSLYLDEEHDYERPYNEEHFTALYGLYKYEEDLDEKIECGWKRRIGYVIR